MKLECGKISNEIFQIVCVNAINKTYQYDDELAHKMAHWEFLIDLIKRTEFTISEIKEHTIISYNIRYDISDSTISIDGKWQTDYDSQEYADIIEKMCSIHMEELTHSIATCLKDIDEVKEMVSRYNYVLNPVSCFNDETGEVEHLRLTPHCTLLNVNRHFDYNDIDVKWRHILYLSENGKFIAAATDKYGIGKIYMLNNDAIASMQNSEKHIWWPICSIIKNSGIQINVPMLVKDEEDDSFSFWLFLTTSGIIYDDNTIISPLHFKEREINGQLCPCLCYDSDNKSIMLSLLNEPGFYISTEVYENRKFSVIKTGNLQNHSDDLKLMALINRVSDLGKCEYYDGSEFKELITRDSRKIRKEIAEQEKWAEEHPILYLLASYRKQIFIAIIVIVFMLIGLCS